MECHVPGLYTYSPEIIFRAASDLSTFGKFAYKTLQIIQEAQVYDGNVLYSILHEPIYCQGYVTSFVISTSVSLFVSHLRRKAPKWSAERVLKRHLQFSWDHVKGLAETVPVYFYGEMVHATSFSKVHSLITNHNFYYRFYQTCLTTIATFAL